MEEADLLKERLQAITDKRRIQEAIAKKKRQIEEEKLKFQYIKKKALREQWLMDGLSRQSEDEQEALRLQAQDEQQQSDQLQSNILRIEEEIEALETEELNISANEEVILKRLKEVERTAEDIIKKATLVDREADGKQLKEGCSITENHCFLSVAMETAEQSKLAMDCEVEVLVADLLDQKEDFSAKDETDSSGTQKELVGTFLTHTPTSTKESVNLNSSETSVCAGMPCQGQEEYLISETAHEVLSEDWDASVASPVTDTHSSPDRVYENEVQCEEQESPEQDPEQEPEQEEHTEPSKAPEPEQYPETEGDFEMGDYLDQELHSVAKPDIIVCPEDAVYQNLAENADEDSEFHESVLQPTFKEVSILEQCIKDEALSDVSNESCHNHDEMDECLTVEIAAESSDSEADEKWRTIFSSSINKEDDDSYLDSLQLSAQELFVHKVETTDLDERDNNLEEVHFEVPQVEEVLEQPDSFSAPPQEVKHISLGLQGLSKISEDEGENGRDANHNHTSNQQNISADKKLPKDFCVIQETKNENVSTEHVDFQLARKQWREMEEQVKSKIVLPTTKQPSFHGSHSFMYKPVRNIERTQKKGHELENLNLAWDYSHTQFSPCSDDSGLCDSSFRSPYDDLETPIEREIRISMEREESFRKERELSRIPRSISTPLTPSFIVTTSASKEPHDMSSDNVIILDPTSDFTSSPNDQTATPSGDWCSEDGSSNLVIPETSSVIIRSASDFSLNKACEQPQEKIFLNNPFFKLRSRSTMSLVDEEIKMVKQREEELKKERANLYCKDRFSTEKGLSNRMSTLAFNNSVDVPMKCKSSPSSPMKTPNRMDRSALSCDHRFPEVYAGGRRKSAMALRWEAGEFTKDD